MNIPRTRGSSLCPPSPVADTPGPPFCLLFLCLALLLLHHLWVACHGQGLKLSSSRPIITTAPLYPSALPCGISLPTCPSSLSCRHGLILKGTWEVQYCYPAPGFQEPLHSALPSWLADTFGKKVICTTLLKRRVPHIPRATNGFRNPTRPGTTMPCFNGYSIVNSSITPGTNLGRRKRCSTRHSRPQISLGSMCSLTGGPSRFAAP